VKIYSTFLKSILLPLGDLFFGGSYTKEIKKWKKYDSLDSKSLEEVQENLLDDLLKDAVENVPYYASQNSLTNKKNKLSIKDFPILTKEILRKEYTNLVSKKYDASKLEKNHSSGSSGTQSFTFMTQKHKFYLRALQTHWFKWSGFEIGMPIVQLGMSPKRTLPKKLKDIFFRVTYINSFFLSKDDLLTIAQKMKNGKIRYMAGYPSEMNEIAKIIIANNLEYKMNGIVSLGDKLFNHYIKNYNEAFKHPEKIIDTYGCAEGMLMACRKDLPFYYIMSPHVYLEIVDDDGNEVEEGKIGHVLVTCLTNKAMPIIRYKLGDLAAKLPKHLYPEKRDHNYPLLEKIIGRDTDCVTTADGINIFVTTFVAIMEFYPEIKQFKIVQENLKSITIEYLTDDNFLFRAETLLEIENEINKLTQNNLEIIFQKVEFVSPSKSGKPQVIESRIKEKRF
jgi:phenylacetate-CoA ligase